MGSVNSVNNKTDQTVQIFDKFYRYKQAVPADQYDAVNSYFASMFKNAEAAANFTVSLFRISNQTKIPVMTLLQKLQRQGQTAMDLTFNMAYYLNGVRSPSTLLGVNVPVQPNYYVANNIRI